MKILRLTTPLLIVLGILLTASTAFAAGHEVHFDPIYFTGVVLNFGIFAFIVYRFGKPALNAHYAKQRELLIAHLDTAKELRERAESKLQNYQKRLDNLEQERQEILERYVAEGEREKERIIEEAQRQAKKMEADAAIAIHTETQRAIKALETEALERAMALAEDKLKSRVNDSTEQWMIDQLTTAIAHDKPLTS